MSHSIRLISAWLLFVSLLWAPLADATQAQDDEAELRRIKTEEWPRLYREQDVAGLDWLLHPSFESMDAAGTRSTKAEELDYVAANKPAYQAFSYEIERLDIYPQGVAIVDGTGKVQEDECNGFAYRSSNVMLKEEGRWRPIASHVSGVTKQRGDAPACDDQQERAEGN